MWITDWTVRAACRGTDPDELFVEGAAQYKAKLICRGCPVRTECLADALDNGIEFGVWGGMTERERRALLRRRPDIISWRDVLERARDEYERRSSGELVVAERPGPPPGWWSSVAQPTAGSSTTSVDHDRRRLMEVEVKQCSETGFKPLVIFLTLAGRSYPEATVEAQRILGEAYLRDRSDHLLLLRLRQIAEERLQSCYPLPAEQVPPASLAFSACVSIASRHVLDLLAALPKPQRLALAWAVGGCNPAEIAGSRGHALKGVLADLQEGRDALKHALDGGPQYGWAVDDDGLGDADLDEILMAVVDELADAIALADITAATEAIMAEIAPASSLPGLRSTGDHRALL